MLRVMTKLEKKVLTLRSKFEMTTEIGIALVAVFIVAEVV